MTLSSSDGWPLTGPNESVRRWPLISLPSTNVSSSSPTPAAAHVYLYWRSHRSERTTIAIAPARMNERTEPDQLDVGEAEVRAADVLDDEVLGQPLHQQEADPAEQPDGRQQDLVGAAAGDDLGDVDAEQDAEIDERGGAARPARGPWRSRLPDPSGRAGGRRCRR